MVGLRLVLKFKINSRLKQGLKQYFIKEYQLRFFYIVEMNDALIAGLRHIKNHKNVGLEYGSRIAIVCRLKNIFRGAEYVRTSHSDKN